MELVYFNQEEFDAKHEGETKSVAKTMPVVSMTQNENMGYLASEKLPPLMDVAACIKLINQCQDQSIKDHLIQDIRLAVGRILNGFN